VEVPTASRGRQDRLLQRRTDGAPSVGMVHATIVKRGPPAGFKTLLGRYFYFCMALLMTGLAVWGFSSTVDARLLHAKPPRPLLLWFHGAAFSAWMALFVAQSALVRVRKVSVHRTLGWFGAALAATMVVSGLIVTVVMMRFDITVLHRKNVAPFLSVLWCDLIVDGRVNQVYRYVFPAILVLQALATYLERVNPSWWQAATLTILGS
jgi:uncharacterized membrane protein